MSLELFEDPALDRALARGLSALAPEVEAVDATLAELRPRFHQARTRRRVVRASAAIIALLVVGSAAFAAAPGGARRAHVTVEAPDRRIAPTTAPTPKHTSSRKPRRATAATEPTTKPVTIPATNPPPVSSAPGTSSAPQRIAVVPPSPTSAAPTQTTAPRRTAPAPVSSTYWSSGGHITVRVRHGRMTLTGVFAAKGYQPDIRVAQPDKIDVRFTRRGRWGDSEIELDVVNGRVVQTEGNSDSWPMSGISSVSPPPGHRLALHPAHSSASGPGRSAGHGAAHLVDFRTVLSKRGPKVQATNARPFGKRATPRRTFGPVDG